MTEALAGIACSSVAGERGGFGLLFFFELERPGEQSSRAEGQAFESVSPLRCRIQNELLARTISDPYKTETQARLPPRIQFAAAARRPV